MTIPTLKPHGARRRADGVAAVEFALLALTFFTFVFGIMEATRLTYTFTTRSRKSRAERQPVS